MNKKIITTNERIFQAFTQVLNVKDFNHITIQDVLDKSGVARSTFYAHYKTKEDVLESICTTIFDHVFSHSLKEERSHDFSHSSVFDYKHFITHIFYHLHDERRLIEAIFSSQSKDIFLNYLRQQLQEYAVNGIDHHLFLTKDLPRELKLASVVESFVITIQYWIKTGFAESPEQLTNYLLLLNT